LAPVLWSGGWLAVGLAAACSSPRAAPPAPPAAPPAPAPDGMVWIPGGEFRMGGDDQYALPEEQPVHPVRVDGFYLAVHPVTNAEFARFVAATGYVTVAERAPDVDELMAQLPPGSPRPDPAVLVPGSLTFRPTDGPVDLRDWSQWWEWTPGADWRHPNGPASSIEGKDDFPVVQVAWDDAVAYAAWAGGRLPTEAEWEYAARGGIERAAHAWGDQPFDAGHPQAHIYEGRFPTHAAEPVRVGSYAANRYGLHDMAGNVWQWTLDWYRPDTYTRDAALGTVINPTGPSAGLDPRQGVPSRVVRGGSFLCNDSYCRGYRVSARSPGSPDTGMPHTGFRVALTVEQRARLAPAAADPAVTPGQ
ncbi:MAG: formylglycine-generating enzyme family protein, partial [Gemmatimonadales bacterium]